MRRALEASLAEADPRKGFRPSSPGGNRSNQNSGGYNSNRNGRSRSPDVGGFVPPQKSSVINSSQSYNINSHQPSSSRSRENSQDYTRQSQQEEQQGAALRSPTSKTPNRVRALYDFEGETAEELAFRKGDTIKVLECVYETWWRGELRGRIGIFPTVYVVSSTSHVFPHYLLIQSTCRRRSPICCRPR